MRLPRALERFMGRKFGLRRLPATDDFWYTRLYDSSTVAGISITEDTALSFSAVYACVKRLAESVGSLPLPIYRRTEGGREKDVKNPLYRILHDQSNSEMTAKQYRQAVITSMALWGNSYSFIERSITGEVLGLWPMNPAQIEVDRNGEGRVIYIWRPSNGGRRVFQAEDILHPRLFSIDGLVGLSPIAQAREVIGLGLAEQAYGARLFSNDARPGGVLEHPGHLDDEIHGRLKRSWEETHRGLHNAWKVAILEEGMKWSTVGMPAKDAEFIAARKLSVTEICRFYGMPPHMIQDLERSTFSNIEQQGIEFVTYTLMPWTVEIEQEITAKLMSGPVYAEFTLNALLRGDTESRYKAYAIGRQWGWLSANDVRTMENLNRIEGGDEYMVPLNMIPAGQRDVYTKQPVAKVKEAAPEEEEPTEEQMRRVRLIGGRR
jgi:HK97 family phage portal protein